MRIKYRYNHLHAEEYLYYRKENLINEIEACLKEVDANKYLKISCDKANLGMIYYDQKMLNNAIKDKLTNKGWKEYKTSYYVTSDQNTIKEIVKIQSAEEQKQFIIDKGQEPLQSFNQVDFLKDRIAVEVQFGKYFSVAYDLHVKHTFFYLRDDIEVGIEIIPTHKMMRCMDTGVAWYENEVTNVIREGRNNPAVPVYILGIEPENFISDDLYNFEDGKLRDILDHSDRDKLLGQINKVKKGDVDKWKSQLSKEKDNIDNCQRQLVEIEKQYRSFQENSNSKQLKRLLMKKDKLEDKLQKANIKFERLLASPPSRLDRINRFEKLLSSSEIKE